jgi:hypothetical protein
MRWGVRKGSSSSSSTTSSHTGPSADHVVAQQHATTVRNHGVKALSNAELQQLVTRLNLEKQHRDLVSQAPSKVDRGHNHVKKVLKIGKTVGEIYNLANSPAGKALKKAVVK